MLHGEASFVNPYRLEVSRNRNVVSTQRTGEGFVITTRGAGIESSYYIDSGNEFLREFRITDRDSQRGKVYSRCRGPLGLR